MFLSPNCRSRFWLMIPPVVVYLTDFCQTLAGQPSPFWQGNYGLAVEHNPLLKPVLAHGPWVFTGVVACWLMIQCLLLLRLPSRWAFVIAFVMTLFHAIGASSWLVRNSSWGYLWAGLFLLITSETTRTCWRHWLRVEIDHLNEKVSKRL
ncbi:MAG: hypothetical protein R3B84_18095 [Zavarzinella sp.]